MRKNPIYRLSLLLAATGLVCSIGCRMPQRDGMTVMAPNAPDPTTLAAAEGANPTGYAATPVGYEQSAGQDVSQWAPANSAHAPASHWPSAPSQGPDAMAPIPTSQEFVPPPSTAPRWRFGNCSDSHAANCPCCRGGMANEKNPLSEPVELLGVSSELVRAVSYQEGANTPLPCPPEQPCPPTHFDLPRWVDMTGGRFTPPDEMIFDGGDDGVEVLIERDWTVRGLDQEDTIGHFDTLNGRRMVAPSNRVPIYAPRFGSVRKIYGIAGNEGHVALGGVQNETQVMRSDEVAMPSTTLQQLQPRGQVGQISSTTFRDRTRGMEVDNEVASSAFENRFSTFEDLGLIRYGNFDQNDKARLAEGLDAANAWGHVDAISDVVDNLKIEQLGTGVSAGETVNVEEDESRPRLRLVKVASRSDALPGEIVEFTIRFDNVGNEVIGNVTILDHLSPRLELIEGSAQCSLPAEFFVTEQNSTTQIFRAEITDPVQAGQGGIVRFKCLVR